MHEFFEKSFGAATRGTTPHRKSTRRAEWRREAAQMLRCSNRSDAATGQFCEARAKLTGCCRKNRSFAEPDSYAGDDSGFPNDKRFRSQFANCVLPYSAVACRDAPDILRAPVASYETTLRSIVPLRQAAREFHRILPSEALRLCRKRTDALNRQSPDSQSIQGIDGVSL